MTQLWVTADELSDPNSPDAVDAAASASSILWALSGRKYSGVVTATEEYECSVRTICSASSYRRYTPSCGVHKNNRVALARRPVRTVYEVVEAPGTPKARVIDPAEYEVINRMFLRPVYGASWKPCSKLQVTYEYGSFIPSAGRRAARILAEQLLKASSDPASCALPDRVTSVSRQGVSFTILDPQDFLKDGRTGIYEIDLFLKATNPDNARKRSRVFSPDRPAPARVTASVPGAHDLLISPGFTFEKTVLWETNGAPTHITGNWTPTAKIVNVAGATIFDLTPYLTVEPAGETGRIDLVLSALVTAGFTYTGTWSLIATHVGDPGLVIPLLGGRVAIST